jgi:DNA-binding NarL/FixJ family response regulator
MVEPKGNRARGPERSLPRRRRNVPTEPGARAQVGRTETPEAADRRPHTVLIVSTQESPSVAGSTLRLLIVDDDPLVRNALRAAMDGSDGIQIAGEAVDGDAAIAAALDCRPDVVLLDGELPGLDVVTITRRLREAVPGVHVVVFSSGADDALGIRGLRAGAVGFLVKDLTSDALARSLHGVLRGEAAVSRALSLKIVDYLRDVPDTGQGMRPVWSPLTSREWEVLDLICAGRTTEEVATELELSSETVRTHVKRVLSKLGARSRAEAIEIAGQLRAVEGDWSAPPGPGEGGRS